MVNPLSQLVYGPNKCDRENKIKPSFFCYFFWAFYLIYAIIMVLILTAVSALLKGMVAGINSVNIDDIPGLSEDQKQKAKDQRKDMDKMMKKIRMLIAFHCFVILLNMYMLFQHCGNCNAWVGVLKIIVMGFALKLVPSVSKKDLPELDPEISSAIESSKSAVEEPLEEPAEETVEETDDETE